MTSIMHKAENPWSARLTVNGREVSPDEPVRLSYGDNDVEMQFFDQTISSVNAAIVNVEGAGVQVWPEGWQSVIDYKSKWTFKAEQGRDGQVSIIFYSRDVTAVWEKDCLVEKIPSTYRVVVDGAPHEPGVDTAYPVRDKEMNITLIPDKPSTQPVSLVAVTGYPGTFRSTPSPGELVEIGPEGKTWQITLSGSDRKFSLAFDTFPITQLKLAPGLHSQQAVKLSEIELVKGGTDPSDIFRLNVFTLSPADNAAVSGVRVVWRKGGGVVTGGDTLSSGSGESSIRAYNYQTGTYSAELYVFGEAYSVRQLVVS